jgi:ketosteroid isomerase-like protein
MAKLSHQQMIEQVKAMYAALLSKDEAAMAVLLDPAFVLIEADPLPYRGDWVGAKGCKDLIAAFSEKYYESWNVEVVDFSASDERVVAHLEFKTTGKTTGKSFSMPLCEVWKFKGDKLLEMRPFYWDVKLAGEVAG